MTFLAIPDITATWFQWRKCSDVMDAMWDFDSLYLMKQPGSIRKVFTPSTDKAVTVGL